MFFNSNKQILKQHIGRDQCKDTGMALVLICLLIGFFTKNQIYYISSIPFLLINMVRPGLFKPIARIWIGFSYLLGTTVSKIILSIIFYVMVVPVGIIRRKAGKDTMQIKKWKKNPASVFHQRHHKFKPEDLETPY